MTARLVACHDKSSFWSNGQNQNDVARTAPHSLFFFVFHTPLTSSSYLIRFLFWLLVKFVAVLMCPCSVCKSMLSSISSDWVCNGENYITEKKNQHACNIHNSTDKHIFLKRSPRQASDTKSFSRDLHLREKALRTLQLNPKLAAIWQPWIPNMCSGE